VSAFASAVQTAAAAVVVALLKASAFAGAAQTAAVAAVVVVVSGSSSMDVPVSTSCDHAQQGQHAQLRSCTAEAAQSLADEAEKKTSLHLCARALHGHHECSRPQVAVAGKEA